MADAAALIERQFILAPLRGEKYIMLYQNELC